MNSKEFFVLILSVLTSVAGQLFLKLGAMKIGRLSSSYNLNKIFEITTISEIWLGLIFYALGAFLYIILLTRVNLSVIGPSASLVYVFSALMGYFLFKEVIPLTRLVGLSFIVCGVILVVYKKNL
jgi:drug/metabolite transporter (DMT)-like permease